MKIFQTATRFRPTQQRGATLVLGLIMLLLITLVAISSTREATLEARLVGNLIEQQGLQVSAEMGLRDGERSIISPLIIMPYEPTDTCTITTPPTPCLLGLIDGAYSYGLRFGTADMFRPYQPSDGTQPNNNTSINWYATPAPSGGMDGESENPEYGSMLTGNATFRYEINTQSVNAASNNARYLRSTTARLFDVGY